MFDGKQNFVLLQGLLRLRQAACRWQPRARGEAERVLQEAQAYRQEVTARATGEAQRFKSILAEYVKAEDVTARRLYLETMEEVLKSGTKVIIEGKQGSNGVVPYLPLDQLQKRETSEGSK